MGSISNNNNSIPPLTPLERIGPKGYLRYVFPFQLAENYNLDEVSTILKTGYNALKQRIPVVACEAVPDTDSEQAGVLKLQRLANSDNEDFVVKDLRDSNTFPHHYSSLKDKAFPVSAFDGDILCRRSVWPSPGQKLPTSLVQANFIRGGLILTWCILHMVGDGKSFYIWTKVWADECCRAYTQTPEAQTPVTLPEAIWHDRERIMNPSGRNTGLLKDHPEYTLLLFTPTGVPPKLLSPTHRGQIFYFSPAALKALKAEAAPDRATVSSDQSWISTNDALSALLWRTLMAVQSPLETLDGDPVSVLSIAIDGRQRTDPPVHPETQGCFLE